MRVSFQPRVTVATIVEREGRFLFVEERINGRLVLNQPAGHLDANESLIDAAVRETLEETGWHVSVTELLGVYQYDAQDRHFVRFNFVATALRHEPDRRLDDGIVQALWLTPEELLSYQSPVRSPMVKRCLDDYRAGVRHPLQALSVIR